MRLTRNVLALWPNSVQESTTKGAKPTAVGNLEGKPIVGGARRMYSLHLVKSSFRYGFVALRDSFRHTTCLGFIRGIGV
jgi:hypothetical protein